MRYLKQLILFAALCCSTQTIYGQKKIQLSTYAKISVVTVAPGTELYSKFGHSAFRIQDPMYRLDIVYNYGVFDFNAPHFYTNFAKGKLVYKLARYPFQYFLENNKQEKRWVKEQVLALNPTQKQVFFDYLENNAKPKNASYLYDPFFNNCATKMRDVTQKVLGNTVQFNTTYTQKGTTLRSLMNSKLHWNTWGNLGLNLALGNRLDQEVTATEYMYLPEFVFKGFKDATFFEKNQPKQLLEKTQTVVEAKAAVFKADTISPFFIGCLLLLLGMQITYNDVRKKQHTKWFDFALFLSTGAIGVVLVYLSFFSNHTTTPNNLNLLWAFAPNCLLAFVFLQKKPPTYLKNYLYLLLVGLLCIPVIWMSNVQLFAWSLLPIFLLITVRILFLQYYITTHSQNTP